VKRGGRTYGSLQEIFRFSYFPWLPRSRPFCFSCLVTFWEEERKVSEIDVMDVMDVMDAKIP